MRSELFGKLFSQMSSVVNASNSESIPASERVAKPVVTNGMMFRETVESLAVAFILALLFKAFIAEAFIIPTGSMAPTLMGAHKDVVCEGCGFQYQCGASSEFNEVGARLDNISIAGTVCPLCRMPQVANPNKDPNQATFSGDRILVSKLAYVWNQARRWDVIVFKFIENARQNYIKRCIGLPNETIRIESGDIYVRTTGDFEIARKPPHVANAMLQIVNDTKYVPSTLVAAGMPSLWYPQSSEGEAWKVEWSQNAWQAKCSNSTEATSWLRYYHRVVDTYTWNQLHETGKLSVSMTPRQPRLITDFTAYNTCYTVGVTPKSPKYDLEAEQVIRTNEPHGGGGNDGIHWTGDVAGEFDIETSPSSQTLSLLLVEAGAKHIVDLDLHSGEATARVEQEGRTLKVIEGTEGLQESAKASTGVRAGRKHRIKFSNLDDQLILWIDGKPVDWKPSNRLNWNAVAPLEQRVPTATLDDPLDGAPIGIGVSKGELVVHRAKVFRDIYYIAHAGRGSAAQDYSNASEALRNSVANLGKSPDTSRDLYVQSHHGVSLRDISHRLSRETIDRNLLAENPEAWGASAMIRSRRSFEFTMKSDWFFPMGDNSAASSDARAWNENHTPARLMIGRALVVFWPHYWNAPVPFTPNFQRMGLIR